MTVKVLDGEQAINPQYREQYARPRNQAFATARREAVTRIPYLLSLPVVVPGERPVSTQHV
jgi:hypothetical protein